jgi:type IV pilus assembly protein PilB
LTFARALRSFLRQDPDVILVGEIRDLETAQIGVQASLTGHLVFTTLHTNDAPSSIARLLDLGLEPFLITATLEGDCGAATGAKGSAPTARRSMSPRRSSSWASGLTPDDVGSRTFFYGRGCDYCNHTGYKGRRGLRDHGA